MKYILRFEKLCRDKDFSIKKALKLAQELDLDAPYDVYNKKLKTVEYRTTFMEQAIEALNINMVDFLLENGATPNFFDPEGKARPFFWDLQFPKNDDYVNEVRLEIAQILLEYGAYPNFLIDENEKDLFSTIIDEVFDKEKAEDKFQWEYKSRFFILLLASGGANPNLTIKFFGNFEASYLLKYRLVFTGSDDSEISAVVADPNGTMVAKLIKKI